MDLFFPSLDSISHPTHNIKLSELKCISFISNIIGP